MTRDEWASVRQIVTDALFLSAAEQRAILESAVMPEGLRRQLLDVLRRTAHIVPRVSATLAGSAAALGAEGEVSSLPLAPSVPLLAPGKSIADGRFEVVRQLGRGGMGEVYLAHDKTLGNLVALKVLYEGDVREAQHARLSSGHPHIVTMYDAFEAEVRGRARTALVMEYVAGKPASQVIDDGPAALRDAVRWARQAAAALAHAHDRGVLHCDLKPANILITADEGAKVLDFGIGRATFDRVGPQEQLRGTIPYMAPEQLLEREFTQSGDIYSLGVTLFELVSGRLPYEGSAAETLLQIVAVPPPKVSTLRESVPPLLDDVLARMLAKDPGERYRSARALDRALDEVEQYLVTTTSPVPAPLIAPIPPSPVRRNTIRYAAVAGLALAAAVGSGLLTSWTFNIILDRPAAYDSDTLATQVKLGFRSMFLPAVYSGLTLGSVAGLYLVIGAVVRRIVPKRWRAVLRRFVAERGAGVAPLLGYATVVGGALAIAFVWTQFNGIANAFVSRIAVSDPEVFTTLHPGNRDPQLLYRLTGAILLTLLALAWWKATQVMTAQRALVPAGLRAVATTLMIVLFILCQAPYKALTEHSVLPVVLVGEEQLCYLLGETDRDARVYCPGWLPPRVRTIIPARTSLERCGIEENVFTGSAGNRCPPSQSSPAVSD